MLRAQAEQVRSDGNERQQRRLALVKRLASGEDVKREIQKVDAIEDEAVDRLQGLEVLIEEAAFVVKEAEEALRVIVQAERTEERRRLGEEAHTVAVEIAARVRVTCAALARARGEFLLALQRLAQYDAGAAQDLGNSFTMYSKPGPPVLELFDKGWKTYVMDGMGGASAPWEVPAMLPPDGYQAQPKPKATQAEPPSPAAP